MDSERRYRGMHGNRFDQLAEGPGAKGQRVASRKDYFPDIGMRIKPVTDFLGGIGYLAEGVVLAEAETTTDTAGGGRDNLGASVVILDDAVGFAGRTVTNGIVHKAFYNFELFLCRQYFSQKSCTLLA